MTVTIRPATREDAEVVFRLVREHNKHQKDPVDYFTEETVLRDMSGGDPALSLLLAVIDGDTVGYVLFHDSYDTGYAQRGVYVCDLYVQPAFQRQGIATKLLAAVAKDAESRGRTFLWWASEPWNEGAHKFYAALGAKSEPIVAHALENEAFQKLINEDRSGD